MQVVDLYGGLGARSPERSWPARLLRSRLLFCVVLAAGLVGCRLLFFDAEMFLSLEHVPNHDMLAEAPFFCTNVHSLRTSGEIAWWNPVSYGGIGFAQYYQSFLSPVAPTPGNLSFILWPPAMRVLGWFHIRLSEYRQFLAYTYVFSPFLAFFWFTVFASLLFRRRCVVALVSIAFALSGVGLWLSAWFYFQEPATLFFLLSAWLLFFRRPSVPRGMLLLAAIAVQAASVNYWTIYNSWLLFILLGSHAWIEWSRYRLAISLVMEWALRHRWTASGIGALTVTTVVLWLVLIASTANEQMDRHIREQNRTYSKEEVRNRVQETRWFTVELFNPNLQKALDSYQILNPMHNARYIGMIFVPLLACLPFVRWGRRERWLGVCSAGTLCVCMAPPFLLSAWKELPGMDRILHLFYLYSHYWQLLVILMAGAALDRILDGTTQEARRRLSIVAGSLTALAAVVLFLFGLLSEHFRAHDSAMESASRAGLLMLVFSGALWKLLTSRPAHQPIFLTILMLVAFSDWSRYFLEANLADHQFTESILRRNIPNPLPPEYQFVLDQRWPRPDKSMGFGGGLTRAHPLFTTLWPSNRFLMPASVFRAFQNGEESVARGQGMPPVRFFAGEISDESPRNFANTLILDDEASPQLAERPDGFESQFTYWSYNDFKLQVDVPSDGWLRLYLLHDPLWEIHVDGRRVASHQANGVCSAIQVSQGSHRLELSYRPLARRLFGPAKALLIGCLIAQGLVAWRFRHGIRLTVATAATINDGALLQLKRAA